MARAERSEVWLIDFGLAAKVRPALLLAGESADEELDLFTVLLHTTALRGNPWELPIPKPFLKSGAFHLQQIQTISGAKLLRHLGALSAIEMATVGSITMQGGSVDANTATGRGGGVYVFATFSAADAAISGNSVANRGVVSSAGGIYNAGTATLSRCTLSGNRITGGSGTSGGGAIFNVGTLSATNCTVSGNVIDAGLGSGIGNLTTNAASVVLDACTIAFNVCNATTGGRGIANNSGAAATCHNCLIAKNTGGVAASAGGVSADAIGNFLSTGYNLVGASAASGFGIAGRVGDQVGTGAAPPRPLLASLADNGGPTLTHALQPGSPALDAGEATLGAVATDQRGFPRFTKSPGAPTFPGFDNTDIGAFESGQTALRVVAITRQPGDGSVVI